MPSFSGTSTARLSGCDPSLIALFNYVIEYYDCTIICGFRTDAEQLRLFNSGASRVTKGRHNEFPSMAADVAPYPVDWDDLYRFYHFAGFTQGVAKMMGIKIRWGGDWDMDQGFTDQTFNDLVHFEVG